MPGWSDVGDGDLRDAVESLGLVAVSEVYRRHGPAAYRVAVAITQDAGQAEQAVVSAFVRFVNGERGDGNRPLRAELLDATRRCAGDLVNEMVAGLPPLSSAGPGDVFCSLALEVRSTLALAVAGRCGDAEIAQIMGSDASKVRRTLLVALRQARNLLDAGHPQTLSRGLPR